MAHAAWILLAAMAVNADPHCVTHHDTEVVCFSDNSDYVLERGLVSGNGWTTSITLRDCRITDVEQESFDELPSLEYLDLSVNKISRLESGVLDGFKKAHFLNLSHNRLTEFRLSLFDLNIPNLQVLDLKGNYIVKLELGGFFNPRHKLRYLDLSSNAIRGEHLDPFIFDESRQIGFMDFSGNDMSGTSYNILEGLRAIDFLNLAMCSLTDVPRFATRSNLRTMKHLMLSDNAISKFDDPDIFRHLENLENLNLMNNFIEKIHEDVFKPIQNVQLIFLNNNYIKSIPKTLFQDLQHLNNIDLSSNLIKYVPLNAFRGTKLKRLNLSDNNLSYLQDNFNLKLRNSGARLSHFFFENNPWQCACLNDILVEVKKFGISYSGDTFDGRHRVCFTNEFVCKRQRRRFNENYKVTTPINEPIIFNEDYKVVTPINEPIIFNEDYNVMTPINERIIFGTDYRGINKMYAYEVTRRRLTEGHIIKS